jgi:hypothetical protein
MRSNMDGSVMLLGGVLLVSCVSFYFLPAVIALWRSHRSFGTILFVNLLFGWTGLGWLVCIIWAFRGKGFSRRRPISQRQTRLIAGTRGQLVERIGAGTRQ